MTTNSFEINNYSVLISLNERTIYLKITDQIAFLCYEGNIDSKELRLSIELNNSYELMCKCFAKELDHTVKFTNNSGTMKVIFTAVVGGYLKVNAEIILREKVMSNDGQLTMNFTRLEQTQANSIRILTDRIVEMEKMIEILSNADVYMFSATHNQQHNGNRPYFRLNAIEMTLLSNYWDYQRICTFPKLNKLTLNQCTDITTMFNMKIESNSIEELYLLNLSLNSLIGINKLPNLKTLHITACNNLKDVVKILSEYNHSIIHINIRSCPNINNPEIIAYCQKNNIKLDLA